MPLHQELVTEIQYSRCSCRSFFAPIRINSQPYCPHNLFKQQDEEVPRRQMRIAKWLLLWIMIINLFRAASTNFQSLDLSFIPLFCSALNSKISWAERIYASPKITRYCLSAIATQIPELYKDYKWVTCFILFAECKLVTIHLYILV